MVTVSVSAFSGVQDRAQNAARLSELVAWDKHFKLYQITEGHYPAMANGSYCLGTGFPNNDGSGLGNCRDSTTPGSRSQVSTALNAELSKVSTLPKGPRTFVQNDTLGPYATYFSANYIQINGIFKGNTCPTGTLLAYTYPGNSAVICFYVEDGS